MFNRTLGKVKLFFHFARFAFKYWKSLGTLEQGRKESRRDSLTATKPIKNRYDLIIIGCGPAGLAAAIYAARQKLDFCIISKDIGGQTNLNTYPIENYLGYHYITGVELEQKFEEHLKSFDVKIKNEEVRRIYQMKDNFNIQTNDSTYSAKALLITTGRINKILNIPGELDFHGKGISFCAHCDAPLFKDRIVAVIGGGRSGLDAASQLVNIASKVFLIEISDDIKHMGPVADFVKSHPKVHILTNTKTLEIFGDQVVKGIKVSEKGKEHKLNVDGVFIAIGYKPGTEFVKDVLKMNDRGEIIIDKNNHTSIPGIFAAGDCTDIGEKQVIVAAGEGVQAFIAASEYLTSVEGKRRKGIIKKLSDGVNG